MGVLFASWVFSHAAVFKMMTEMAMRESQLPISAFGLPLPPSLIGMWTI